MRALCVLLLVVAMGRWANEDRYNGIVAQASARHGVPVSLIKAIIAAESAFDPGAIRHEDFSRRTPPSDWPEGVTKDASRGLMQVLCWRAQWLGYSGDCDGLFDPYTNIMAGTKLLATNAAQLGSWTDAISAYNGGMRPELGYGQKRSGRYANQKYVDRVSCYWRYFETGEWECGGFARASILPLIGIGLLAFFAAGAVSVAPSELAPGSWIDTGVIFAAGGAWWKLRNLGKRVERMEGLLDAFLAGKDPKG